MKRIFYRNFIFSALMIISFLVALTNAQSFRVLRTEKIIGNNENSFMAPVWSPDGKLIAFTGEKYKGIWVINLQNKSVKLITDEIAAGFHFKWSNDSKTILTRVARYENVLRYNAVKIFNLGTAKSNLLTSYRTMMPGLPAFVPGDEKVFIYGKNKLEVFNSGIKASQIRKLGNSSKIVYIKDDKIAVQDLSANHLDIYEPVKGERVINLQVSPDGSKAAFEIYGGDMYVMNIDGTGLTDLGKGYRPKWSPDNQHLVYMITEDDGEEILASDIYTIKIDGTEKTNLTNTKNILEMNPDWSPDGNKIAYDVPKEGAIYTIEIGK